MNQLQFSGHESFQCRNLWLKKGYDYITSDRFSGFNKDEAVLELGVGKNMVASIRFWMEAFQVKNEKEDTVSDLGEVIFQENGYDPFLEDIGSLWLLHYLLVTNPGRRASLYSIVFNHFRKHRIEFKKEQLLNFLNRYIQQQDESHSENTVETDVGVFIKMYYQPTSKETGRKSIEDAYSSLLMELNILESIEVVEGDRPEIYYVIKNDVRDNLPDEIFLYAILDGIERGVFGYSISFHQLLNGENSPGAVFALQADALVNKIERITNKYNGLVYKEDGGVKELQVSRELKKENILEQYYVS